MVFVASEEDNKEREREPIKKGGEKENKLFVSFLCNTFTTNKNTCCNNLEKKPSAPIHGGNFQTWMNFQVQITMLRT